MRFHVYQASWWVVVSKVVLFGQVWGQGETGTLDNCPEKINNDSDSLNMLPTGWDDLSPSDLLVRVAHQIDLLKNSSNITLQVQVPYGMNISELKSIYGANTLNPDGTRFVMSGNARNLLDLSAKLKELMPRKVIHLRVPVWLCKRRCGGSYIAYPTYDFWSRIVMWIAPLFMLFGNIHFPPLGKLNIYCVIVHALGDPVDFMASLITRLDVGSTLYRLFKKREVHQQGQFQVSYFGAFDFQGGASPTAVIGRQDEMCGSEADTVAVEEVEDVYINGPGNIPCNRPSQAPAAFSSTLPQPSIEPTLMRPNPAHMHDSELCMSATPTGLAFRPESVDSGSCTAVDGASVRGSQFHSDGEIDDHCVLSVTAQDLATICTAYDDLGHLFPYREMSDRLRAFLRSASIPQKLLVEKALMEAAIDLCEAWTDEMFRAAVAVIGYVLVVAVSFLKTVDPWDYTPRQNDPTAVHPKEVANQGDYVVVGKDQTYTETNPNLNNRTSHSIAFAISYSWVITAVILSAATGGFSNHHGAEKVLDRLSKKVPELHIPQWETVVGKSLIRAGATGMNYSYRPVKRLSNTQHDDMEILERTEKQKSRPDHHDQLDPTLHVYMRTLIAVLPLLVATTCAFLISWFTPTVGFGCRSVHQACLFALYLLSHGLTLLIRRVLDSPHNRAYQYTCIIVKDTIVSAAHITFLFLAFYGWYNSCWCWSAWLSLRDSASVTLYPEEEILSKLKNLFPSLAFGGIAFQFAFVGLLLWKKPKCRIFKRTEDEQLENATRLRRYERQLSGDCNICNR